MVADASVMAAFLFDEPDAARAGRLLDAGELHEPVILAFELTNIACTKARADPAQRSAFAADLADGLTMAIQWEEVSYQAVMDLALETGLSAYDASYLHLAMTLGTPLATFDRGLQAAAQGRVPVL